VAISVSAGVVVVAAVAAVAVPIVGVARRGVEAGRRICCGVALAGDGGLAALQGETLPLRLGEEHGPRRLHRVGGALHARVGKENLAIAKAKYTPKTPVCLNRNQFVLLFIFREENV
jgi:hypothetical protein